MSEDMDSVAEENPEAEDALAESREAPPRRALADSIGRLDALLAEADDEEKVRAGMGIRLALGMAQELKQGKPLGSETGALVAGWAEKYGQESVDVAVKVAREFLIKPDEMRKTLGQRLGLGNPE